MVQEHVLWSDGDWRCELHFDPAGHGCLRIFHGAALIILEPMPAVDGAQVRAEALRRGLLEAPRMD
jgi:hypothetical protein